MSKLLAHAIHRLVLDLVAGDYDTIVADGRGGRLTEAEIRSAIEQYGRTLIVPPDAAFQSVDEYPRDNAPGQSWIDVPLWTQEEGCSDLTLSVLATKRNDTYELQIQDLHVL